VELEDSSLSSHEELHAKVENKLSIEVWVLLWS